MEMEVKILATFFHDYQYGKVLGGVERRFIEISKELRKKGFTTFAVEYKPSLSLKLDAGYFSVGMDRLFRGKFFGEMSTLFKLSLMVIRACKALGCNIVYSTSSDFANVIPAYFASKFCKIPFVIVFHSFPSESSSIIMKNPKSLLKNILQRGHTLDFIMNFLRYRAFLNADYIFTVSNYTKNQVLSSFVPKGILNSGNGISNEWFTNAEIPKMYEACYVGRISPRKRIELLLYSWKEVIAKIPSAKLVIAGGYENRDYATKCYSITEKLCLTNNVIFTGFIDDVAVRNIMISSRIFISTSAKEGFGLSILEAMSQKLPCILPALPSLMENFSNCALFVEGEEPRNWAERVVDLLLNEEKANAIARNAFINAQKYSWDVVASREADVLDKLVSSTRT
jgi:glycosyltransferase involved in cell wall biosynthesis